MWQSVVEDLAVRRLAAAAAAASALLSIAKPAAQLLDEAALYEQYTRVISTEPSLNEETEDVCALLKVPAALSTSCSSTPVACICLRGYCIL